MAAAAKVSFLDAMKSATKDDLKTIDVEIAAMEANLDLLRAGRKILLAKFPRESDGDPQNPGAPGVRTGRTEQGAKTKRTIDLREKLVRMIDAAGSSQTRPTIIKTLALADGEFEHLVKHKWFEEAGGGWTLTAAGADAADKLAE